MSCTILFKIDCANGALETRLVGIVILVKSCIERDIDYGILFLVINPLHSQCFEEEGSGLFKDFLTALSHDDVVRDFYRPRLGTTDTSIGWIGKEILRQSLCKGALEVTNVQRYTLDLGYERVTQNQMTAHACLQCCRESNIQSFLECPHLPLDRQMTR